MLVLRRRAGEAIVIGDDIAIEVIEISRSRVKLGVVAPRSVGVSRRETIPVAVENRLAAGLLDEPGVKGIINLLRGFLPGGH